MISWALCFELNFYIIMYDSVLFLFRKTKGGGDEGVSQVYTVWYDILKLFRRMFLL